MKETNPGVGHITQPESKLCWATSLLMVRNVIKQANADITPQKIAARSFYRDPGDTNIGGYDHIIKVAIEDWIGNCSYVKHPVTWAEVKQDIDNNKPIFVGYSWSTGSGHLMVIGGYENKGDGSWGLVRLFDPALNAHKDISFDRLSGGNFDQENWPGLEKGHVWDASWRLV
jgi:Papain-like cysteine protease AvrRpt2